MQTASGTVHVVSAHPPLTAFEFASSSARNAADPLLLFIAGLGDTLLSVPYLGGLAQAVDKVGWRCAQALLSSFGAGWGTASVEQDAVELAKIVEYYRKSGASRVVLLGHSTGEQQPASRQGNRNLDSFRCRLPRRNCLPSPQTLALRYAHSRRHNPTGSSLGSRSTGRARGRRAPGQTGLRRGQV